MPQLLFSSRSYEDFLNTRRYLTSILEQDRQLIDDYRKRKSVVGDQRRQLKEDEQELQSLKKRTEQKKAEIQKDLLQKGGLLDSVRQEKQIHLASIRELEDCLGAVAGTHQPAGEGAPGARPGKRPSPPRERGSGPSGGSCPFR